MSDRSGRPKGRTISPPTRRRGGIRIRPEAANRVRSGHPWVFRDALRGRGTPPEKPGQLVTLLDPDGQFVAHGYWEPEGAVAVRVLSWDPERQPGPDLYRAQAEQALALRERLIDPQTTAYRLINAEGDGLPGLTVDRYGDYLVAHLFSEAAQPLAEAVYPLLTERLGSRGLYQQERLRPAAGEKRPPAELMRGKPAPVAVEATENGLRFEVDVSAPLGVGLFPDLREVRTWLGQRMKGLRALNTFSYTGAFTVHLAKGGARVVAVDSAARVHGRSRRNLKLNGLDDQAGCEHLTAEAMATISRLAERGERFDLVVLDPPSFARNRTGNFATQRDYSDLVGEATRLLNPGGWILAVSNTARMPEDEFARAVGRGAITAGRPLQLVQRFPLPPDFPVPPAFAEGYYLKALLCRWPG